MASGDHVNESYAFLVVSTHVFLMGLCLRLGGWAGYLRDCLMMRRMKSQVEMMAAIEMGKMTVVP